VTRDPEAWANHWFYRSIELGQMINALRELHQPAMLGGIPDGTCRGCGEPYPCRTRQLIPRKPDNEPCRCARDCPKNQNAEEQQ
jgi:hypothetical protein